MSTQPQFLNNLNKRVFLAALILVLGIIIVLLAFNPLPTISRSFTKLPELSNVPTSFMVNGASYTALAEAFAAKEAAEVWRGQAATAARYTGMAALWETSAIRRGRTADSARYSALAKVFSPQPAANYLRMLKTEIDRYTAQAVYYSVPVHHNPSASLQRGRLAEAARYTGFADQFATQSAANIERARAAEIARYTAAADYFSIQK